MAMAGKGPSLTYVSKDTLNGVTGRSWGIGSTLCVRRHVNHRVAIGTTPSGHRIILMPMRSTSIPAECGGHDDGRTGLTPCNRLSMKDFASPFSGTASLTA